MTQTVSETMADAIPEVLILAAGYGNRLGRLTETTPKCLVPVAGEAPLDRWCRLLDTLPPTRITVNTHHLADQVDRRIARYTRAGPHRWRALHEPRLLGSAGTLARVLDDPALENLLVIYADNISTLDPWAFWRRAQAAPCPVVLGLFRADDPTRCGIATRAADGVISAFAEKPAQPASDLAFAGVLAARAAALRTALGPAHHDIGRDLLPALAGCMAGLDVEGYHRDMGTPEAIAAIERDAAAGLWRPGRPGRQDR